MNGIIGGVLLGSFFTSGVTRLLLAVSTPDIVIASYNEIALFIGFVTLLGSTALFVAIRMNEVKEGGFD